MTPDLEVPQHLLTAVVLDEVQVLLKHWDEVMHPIAEEHWGPSHLPFREICFVAYAIEDIGETLDDRRTAALIVAAGELHQPGAAAGEGVTVTPHVTVACSSAPRCERLGYFSGSCR